MRTTLGATKGRLIRCTVSGLTPNLAAILRTPGLLGVAGASRIRFARAGGYRRPSQAVSLIPDSRKGGTGHRQKSLNRSGASSVYLTVCSMFLCPRPLPPAFFLLLYVNGKYSEIGKKQVFARFPHFPALADMF